MDWAAQFPELFCVQGFRWGGIGDSRLLIQFTVDRPADNLISNVKIIGRQPLGLVVVETDEGWRSLPGGTREPGESVEETAARELAEEAGGTLRGSLTWIGAFKVDHSRVGRHQPHLPFPISYWAYFTADVELRQPSSEPNAGEHVVSVQTLPTSHAIAFLKGFDNGPLTDVVRLAHAMGYC